MELNKLTDEQLKAVAEELELPVETVTKLHAQALKNGSFTGLKEFEEFVEKECGKRHKQAAGKATEAEEDEEEEEEMTEEEKKTKAKEILAALPEDQRQVLKELLDETESPQARLEVELSRLKDMVEAQANTTNQLISLMTAQASGRIKESDVRATMEEILSGLPRRQQAQFGSIRAKEEDGDELSTEDERVMGLLKEIQDEMRGQGANPLGRGGHIYSLFTSKRLNPPQEQ